MRHPEFFDAVPPLRLRDPLAAFLGAAEEGVLEYRYIEMRSDSPGIPARPSPLPTD
jgi:hypothetical protein